MVTTCPFQWLLVKSNDHGSKGHGLNHLVNGIIVVSESLNNYNWQSRNPLVIPSLLLMVLYHLGNMIQFDNLTILFQSINQSIKRSWWLIIPLIRLYLFGGRVEILKFPMIVSNNHRGASKETAKVAGMVTMVREKPGGLGLVFAGWRYLFWGGPLAYQL